ncbi:protein-L-isoaspartate O-methyltransferase [Multifurca ochricompacta]|uniref:Protein-L-isoaspartate O-methyltransferase n=1 Tax=Multifurca ochricompacta TaxID=376703 RepID=A0AAD4QNT1_9AGAM|nr:protein-L-isoaspartate O-methyltransferase [Multifurca ochricompacta]
MNSFKSSSSSSSLLGVQSSSIIIIIITIIIMAWFCTGATNTELISNLMRNGLINSETVAAALMSVDRANYVLDKRHAYQDSPQSIGHDATISAPHMHAHAAELLLPYLRRGARVLDVGAGSGYLTSVFHHIIGAQGGGGTVVGIEHISALTSLAERNIRADGLGNAIDQQAIVLVTDDGRLGYAEKGPYDAIHVGAAARTIPPALVEQLASPGRMIIPVGSYHQKLMQIDKDERGEVTQRDLFGVVYVPLTDRPKGVA